MDKKLVAATASLAMASFVWGAAQATPAPSAIHAPGNGITLVGHQGGGGGGGGGGGEEVVVVAAAVVAAAAPAAAVVSMSAVVAAVPAAAVTTASRDPAEAAEVRA